MKDPNSECVPCVKNAQHINDVSENTPFPAKRGGSVVLASHLGPESRELEPWPVHPRFVVGHNA